MKTVLSLFIAALLGLNSIKTPQVEQVIILPPIMPTTPQIWVDTCAKRFGIPAEVIWAVGWNESHWGQSALARRTNNLFGIKWYAGCGQWRAGQWRAYWGWDDSVLDFCNFITKHYPQMIGRPLERWELWGYAEKPYKFDGTK